MPLHYLSSIVNGNILKRKWLVTFCVHLNIFIMNSKIYMYTQFMNYNPQLQIFRNMPVQLLRSGSSVPCNIFREWLWLSSILFHRFYNSIHQPADRYYRIWNTIALHWCQRCYVISSIFQIYVLDYLPNSQIYLYSHKLSILLPCLCLK